MAPTKSRDRDRTEHRVLAAQTARLADSEGCHWLTPAVEMAALAGGNWPQYPDAASVRWTCFPAIATTAPGLDASRVRAARDFTISTLQRWGVAERCEDVAVVVSELLTNALRHAPPPASGARTGWPIRLGLLQPGQCVMCAVADPSRAAPVPRTPEQLAESGRGLHVIAALSDQWGYTAPTDMGKVLWAVFSARLTRRPSLPRPRPDPRSQHAAEIRP